MDLNQNPPTLQPINASTALSPHDPDEINLLEYVYVLVKNKWWIIGFTVLGLVLGYVAAIVKGPTYVTEAVIAPKESESQKTPNFAGLGALGGIVASQLSMGGNASLDKITLLLESRKFNADMIEKYDLLPFIYKKKYPKIYKKIYNENLHAWDSKFVKPMPLSTAGMVSANLKKEINKNNTMTLKIESKDSTFSDTVLVKYLDYLNSYIRSSVQDDAKENVSYIEKQLETVADPLLREKLQALIASELEKAMLVSKEAFKVIDPPYSYVTFKQKKMFPMVFGAGMFFMSCLAIVFGQAFSSAEKTKEDKTLIEKIKRELMFLPKKMEKIT
jgi:LPS O-antigen subunit length determinant protein (WzzB/FepE family)